MTDHEPDLPWSEKTDRAFSMISLIIIIMAFIIVGGNILRWMLS